MNGLAPPDLMHLDAAEGWLGLGNAIEANVELEKIDPRMRAHPDVLEVRYEIYAMEGHWAACVDIASAILEMEPKSSFGWIRRSFALHELKRTAEARENLLPAAHHFPEEITIRYNLACYECVLGNMGPARLRLAEAFRLAQNQDCFDQWRLLALDDKDLEPLWGQLGAGLADEPLD
jgi:predicted Zn-dependent protease